MLMKDLALFKPAALAHAPIISEGRLIRDLSAPECDWSEYDAPAWERLARPNPFRQRELPAFLRVAL
jgi:hypothetical protein